jgi:outer membrane protein assembly factor BamB
MRQAIRALTMLAIGAAGLMTALWVVGGAGAITKLITSETIPTTTNTVPTTTQTTPAPTISSFAPASGSPGTSVQIQGAGLFGATAVRFNGTPAQFAIAPSNPDSLINTTVPAGAISGPITVETPAGTATGATAFVVTTNTVPTTTQPPPPPPPPPTISSFSPSSGSPGTSVVIRGTGFGGTTAVRFNGTTASFTLAQGSDSLITTTVPAGAATGPISVQTPIGTATSAASFVVTTVVPDLAVAYQIDVAHDGVQSDPALNPPFERRWTSTFANAPSYPLIAAGKVFVTVSSSGGNVLAALSQADGHTLWTTAISGNYALGPAYDAGQVFVVNTDGLLRAFDSGTGAQNWITQLPGQYMFSSPPVAAHGVVYTGGAGSGGTLYAVDELTGGVLATRPVENGDDSSPSLSDTGVFVGYACNQAYGFAQTSLAPLWHYTTSCEGGGGETTVFANGDVFTRDYFGNLVLDAATGTLLSTYPGGAAPAVDKTTVFALSQPTLFAQSLSTALTRWTFSGDGGLVSAPIVVVTPFGEFVIAGSTSGALYALDAATGAQVWSTNVGGQIPQSGYGGLAAGQGLLLVPAGNSLIAYTGQGTFSGDTTPPTISVPADITAEATGPSGAVVSYTVTASDPDNTPAQITITCAPSSGSTLPLGTNTVTCNAHDPAGNNATPAHFQVTVRDTTPPTISGAGNVTVNATSPTGATVTFAPQAADLVDGNVPTTCAPASGTAFKNGATTVKCTAKDARGNTASASFTVTVLSAAPQLSTLSNAVRSASELQSPTQKKLRDKLTSDLTQAGQPDKAKACKALTQFVTDVQANTAPHGPITSDDAATWIAAANAVRPARVC